MQKRSMCENQYRKTMTNIGFAMLAFIVLFYTGVIVAELIPTLISMFFPLSQKAFYVTYLLLYGAAYLFAFMAPALVLRLISLRNGFPYRSMYAVPKISKYLPLMIFAVIMLTRATAYLNSFFISAIFPTPYTYMESPLPMEWYDIVLQFIIGSLVPGFCEEFFFRGAILTNCLRYGRTNAILISAVLFALMHGNLFQMFYTFVAGVLLGIVYEKTKSIWNCIILHVLNNAFSLVNDVIDLNLSQYSAILTLIFELIVCLLGVVSVVVLVRLFFSEKKDLSDGFYQKRVEACDEYAVCPLKPAQAIKHFFMPTVIVFIVLSVITMFLL